MAVRAAEAGEARSSVQFPELGFLLLGDAAGIAIELLGGLVVPLLQNRDPGHPSSRGNSISGFVRMTKMVESGPSARLHNY
jgi:hypothetical protein